MKDVFVELGGLQAFGTPTQAETCAQLIEQLREAQAALQTIMDCGRGAPRIDSRDPFDTWAANVAESGLLALGAPYANAWMRT